MSHSWRDSARPIIANVLRENEGRPVEVIKKALFDAYPFGERQYHPYKVWLDEIKRQTGRALLTPKQREAAEKKNAAQMKLQEWNELYGEKAR